MAVFISDQQRRARLGRRQLLASPGASPEEVAEALVGIHSSDPATPYLSVRARAVGGGPEQLETALYQRRTLVRAHGMRRTLFVVPRGLLGTMDVAATRGFLDRERSRVLKLVAEGGLASDPERFVSGLRTSILTALAELGEATAAQLTAHVPGLGHRIQVGPGTVALSTRMLFLLAVEGEIVRARPLGSWRSGQYRWARATDWLGGLPEQVPVEQAEERLVSWWLRSYGPGTERDIQWWTGWTLGRTRRVLERVAVVEVDLAEGFGFVLPDDLDPEPNEHWVAFLPGLDQAVMGYKERGWFLGPHEARLFDRNGNVGPSIWSDGRIVGAWGQRPDGTVAIRMLEDVGQEVTAAIEAEAGRLEAWLAGERVIPRFRTDLEKELSGTPGT